MISAAAMAELISRGFPEELRSVVRGLAITGLFAESDPRDGSIACLVEGGALIPIVPRTGLPSVPDHWEWFELEQLVEFGPRNGYSPRGVDFETPTKVLTLTATTSGVFKDQHFKYVDEEIDVDSTLWLDPGDLLIQRSNSIHYVGTMAVFDGLPGEFIFPDLMIKVRISELAEARFVHLLGSSPFGREFFRSRASGTSGSMPKINQGTVRELPVPLPPLPEQRRTIEACSRLLGQLEDLEAARAFRDQWCERARASCLHALVENGEWDRVRDNWNSLFTTPESVDDLRRAILDLAVRGRLVDQRPEEGNASQSSQAVIDDASWRAPERSFRARPEPSIEALAGRLRIPRGWVECRLNEVAQLINGRAYKQAELLQAGTPVIRIQNLNGGQQWYFSDLDLPARQMCESGDLLFAWSASFGPYIWSGPKAIYHYHIWKLVLSPAILPGFAYHLLGQITEEVRQQSHGLAMLHMTKNKMQKWPLLLPPLAEQHRIVAKVDELMRLCDELEARLQDVEDISQQLAESVVHHVGSAS